MTLKDGERGRFYDPMTSWTSKDSDDMSVLVHIDGRVSLDEILDYLTSCKPIVSASAVLFNGSIRWERPATPAEHAKRAEWRANAAKRHLEWQRKFFDQMIEQFGPDGPPRPDEVPGDISLRVAPRPTDGAGRPLPDTLWLVRATHVPTGLSATQAAEYKLPAMDAAIRAVRERVQAECESC